MIIAPTFLDHWKVKLLETELGDDPCAALYVIRLWGHCQAQKTPRFPKLSAPALAAICRYKPAPERLWLAMQTAGFIVIKNGTVVAHQWDEYNSSLISSWENGSKGGRPAKNKGTRQKPKETHGLTGNNPAVTDREEKIEKIDEIGLNTHTGATSAPVGEAKKTTRREIPTLEQWLAAAKELRPDWPEADARLAWEHYEKVGWKAGRNPVQKWRMCIGTCYRNWQDRTNKHGSHQQTGGRSFEQRNDYSKIK